MDAVFALDGKVPLIDYASRQPLYTYAIAGYLKLLGTNYTSGRLLSLTCSVLIGFMIFLMSRTLFDKNVALLSAAIYWMLPLELINSVLVKTQPLVTLLICLSFYAMLLFSQTSRAPWLMLAGVFAATGFYVRQSALIIPLVLVGFLLLNRGRAREVGKSFVFFLTGYVFVFSVVLVWYSSYAGADTIFMSGINPFAFLAIKGRHLYSLLGPSLEPAIALPSQAGIASYDQTDLYYKYMRQAFYFHSFLLAGLGFSIITVFCQFFSQSQVGEKKLIRSNLFLYLWICCLLLAYIYFLYVKGFYIDYFREFLPPLVILFAAWLCHAVPALEKDSILECFIVVGLCISAIFFFILPNYKEISGGTYASLSIAVFCVFYFNRYFESQTRRLVFMFALLAIIIIILLPLVYSPFKAYFSGKLVRLATVGLIFAVPCALLRKGSRPRLKGHGRFVSLSVALAAFVFSLTCSAGQLTLQYDSPWSPQSLEEISSYLVAHTPANATVISGATIWELQAARKPFLNISHPLVLAAKTPNEEKQRLRSAILTQPPEVIILDGYTERTYFKQLPWLNDFLRSRYKLVHTATAPSRYPVELYRLRATLGPDA